MNDMADLCLQRSGLSGRQYILGRRNVKVDDPQPGVLMVGKYLAMDGSKGSEVFIDCQKPHAILICGKRGYGKSYTMGMLIEELALQPPPICNNIASIVIDSMGIFWTMGHSNKSLNEIKLLSDWRLSPRLLDIHVYVPPAMVEEYTGMGISASGLTIPPGDLSGTDWCELFEISPVHPVGVLITRAVYDLKKSTAAFSLQDISDWISADPGTNNDIKNGALNFLSMAQGWKIFEKSGLDIRRLIRPGRTAVIDVSSLPDNKVRSLVVGVLARRIYQARVAARRQHEVNKIAGVDAATMPMVWMFIDEAHLFMPGDRSSLTKDVLVNEWLRQGRQPGLSLVMATQQPSALDPVVLSQSDIILCHRLTSHDDISALEKVRPTFMRQTIADSIQKMGEGKGVAFIVDDTTEASHVVQMRPRLTWHGGEEPSSLGR